jgi:hypothetical protein
MNSKKRLQGLQMVLVAIAAVSACGAQQAAAPQDPATESDAPVAQVAPAPVEAPPLAPKVVCTGNQMTISANNSTLSSVLAEVHRCMGTKIDLPEGAGEKRMFDHIGPGPATQVLDELLSNTGYNYIIGSAPADQEKIESIMLLARTTDAAALSTAITDGRPLTNSRRAFLQMHQASIPHPMTDADAAAAAEAAAQATAPAVPAETTTPAPASTDAPQAPATDPNQKPAETAPTQPAEVPPTPPPATSTTGRPVTTDDQINNMQQMFELRKQMNQPQPPPPQ